jgi:hypothetical protein
MRSAVLCACLLGSMAAFAQPALKLPDASPAASVSQTVGLTDITVTYHRPAVAGRPIWGQLVPYGEPWRAGANENTTIAFSSDVKVAGKPLKAGTYGLHVIPTAKDWTFAFSTMAVAWGSFTYDPKEDALRVTVSPRTLPASEERLSFRFDDPGETRTTLVLSWERLAASLELEVDTPGVAMASVRQQLRGIANFSDRAQAQAADYWVNHGDPLDEALRLVDRSIQLRPSYTNQTIRAAILEKQGDAKGAGEERKKALAVASEGELNQAAYGLMGNHQTEQALAMFRSIVQRYPESWNAHDSLGEALALKGDRAGAAAEYARALALAKDPVQRKRIDGVLARLKGP